MKSKDYWGWRDRDLLYNKQLEKAEGQLAKEYLRVFKKTKRDLLELYYEISNGEDVLVSDLYKFNKYYDLLNNLNAELVKLGEKEIAITELTLGQMYERNSKLIDKELGFNSNLSPEKITTAINATWCSDNKKWTDRVWNGKQGLEEKVRQGLVDCVARGDSKDRLVKQLMETFDIGYRQSDRLVRTELAYVQTRSTIDTYKEANVEYYEILTAEDEGVCDICDSADGKYRIDDTTHLPPFHPNCRCSILAVIEGRR